jgi:hypothetical protein
MTTTTESPDARLTDAIRDLLDEIETLSADYGEIVKDAVALAKSTPFDPAQTERLYEMVARLLRGEGQAETEDEIAAEVRRLVVATAPAPPVPAANPWGSVTLVERNGLRPHPVVPVPTFNGKAIPMYEGYVDITTLGLWDENHRVELQVAEFRERNHREPDPDELLSLVQGELRLPSLDKKDPYNIIPLANSIARKGVERPPILTADGVPRDGNRRIAAAKYVVSHDYTAEQKDNARWVKVWVAPPATTEDQLDAVIVALNFEDDLREKWPEFIKARLVVDAYRTDRAGIVGAVTPTRERALKKDIAERYAISTGAVTRYIRMVQWAEDFEKYHVEEEGKEAASVRYRADKIFQWFFELQAGKTGDKITEQIEEDEELRKVVYDLMYDAMDAGTQVRSLWKVVADPEARQQLMQAHESLEKQQKDDALSLVKEAVTTADRNNNKRKQLGFDSFLRSCVDRLGSAPPDNWQTVDSATLKDLERVFGASFGVIEGLLVSRGERAAAKA